MPNFKEFIKGFEEKPEAKNPNPAPTPKPQEVKMEEPKPKKTVGEDLQEMYEKEFFKQANGNKEDFVNHFINRFGVPKGSSKKREAEFYGKRFDELGANQPKEAPKAEPKRPMTNKEIRDEHLKIKEKMDEKQKELGRKVNKEEYDEILNEVRNAPQPKPKFQDELEGIVQGLKEDEQKEYDERFLSDATMHLTEGLSPEEKAEVNKRFKALLDKEGFENITPETRYKEGSFEQVFGEPKPLSEEDLKKADIAAEWIDSAYGYDGWRAEKLPNGNFLTNVHTQDPDAEPEEVSPEIFVEQFKELLDNEDEGFIDFLNSEHGYNIPVKTKARKK